MATPAVDYAALADRARQQDNAPKSVDYAALADQARGGGGAPTSKSFADHLSDAAGRIWEHVNPKNLALGMANATSHPVDFVDNWRRQNGDIADKAEQAFKRGDYAEGVAHSIKYLMNIVPGLGSAAEKSSDEAEKGNYGQAIGDAMGPPLAIAAYGKAADYVPAVASKLGSAAKTAATEVLGKTTGAGASALRTAIENPSPDFTAAMRGGVSENEILGHARDALQNVKDARAADYQAKLAALPQGTSVDIMPVRDALNTSLAKHNVKIDPATGELDFSRSTISDAAAQNAVKSIYTDIKDWGTQPEDLTPKGVDILKRRIDDLYAPTSNARAIVQNVKGATRDVLNTQVPGYNDMTRGYAEASQHLDQLKDLSLESKNDGTAIRKLTTTLNQNNGYRQMLLEGLDKNANVDLPGEVAGLALSKWPPRGIMGPLAGAGVAEAMGHAVTPPALLGLAMTSPRAMGELMQLVGKARAASPLTDALAAPVDALGKLGGVMSVGTSPRLMPQMANQDNPQSAQPLANLMQGNPQ